MEKTARPERGAVFSEVFQAPARAPGGSEDEADDGQNDNNEADEVDNGIHDSLLKFGRAGSSPRLLLHVFCGYNGAGAKRFRRAVRLGHDFD
ncbi:hypothetical protein PSAL_013720 [Pseudooceanicola algae]|uniref:Uncharacterized protein n=1 Tax=Pseudooceanicola algae TaxID=1537215 RepID=A0A418SJ57_9RHOB|nr:hypothetical protein PSAL_013720 [Pseudooceanicola algae]